MGNWIIKFLGTAILIHGLLIWTGPEIVMRKLDRDLEAAKIFAILVMVIYLYPHRCHLTIVIGQSTPITGIQMHFIGLQIQKLMVKDSNF